MRAMRRQRGFTLTELMVVVLIFSVLAGLAYRSFGRRRKSGELDGFARAIQRTITLARRRALETGTRYLVDIRPRSVAYCQLPVSNPKQTTCPSAGLESPSPYLVSTAAEVVYFARDVDGGLGTSPPKIAIGTGTALYMLPNGSCDSDLSTPLPEGFTAYVQGTDDKSLSRRTIAIFPLTARPRLTDSW